MLQEAAADNMYLDIIDRNSKRINDLISELLSSARPAEMVMDQHILQNIIDEVVGMAMDRLTLKKIKLDLSYPDVPLVLNADKEKLKIALLNIIINAIEAMKEQEGQLIVSLTERPHAYVLKIADNGCGISEENITRLFEPYFTQKRNGMGLGLAATLNILQAHNANIEVASTEGVGTTFTIIFSTDAA
jgi:signal transduction histidine kinase